MINMSLYPGLPNQESQTGDCQSPSTSGPGDTCDTTCGCKPGKIVFNGICCFITSFPTLVDLSFDNIY